jgi:hypothetical protein
MIADFILEVGKLTSMEKAKSQGKEFSTIKINIYLKDTLHKEKEMDLEL